MASLACPAGAAGLVKFATFKKFALERERDESFASDLIVTLESALGWTPRERKPMVSASPEVSSASRLSSRVCFGG